MHKRSKTKGLNGDFLQLELFARNFQHEEFELTASVEKDTQVKKEDCSLSLSSNSFDDEEIIETGKLNGINEVNGLTYVRNFISQDEHDFLLQKIDREPWLTDLKRRVQHYGYKYDYAKHEINGSMYISPLPEWSLGMAQRLHESYSETLPDQVIVNEYEPGQGIANHTDCKTCFTDTIISLSLGSLCVMDFINNNRGLKKSILLEPRSLIILTGEARYEWTHGIAKRKSDKLQGQVFKRMRRISLTFRTVILPD